MYKALQAFLVRHCALMETENRILEELIHPQVPLQQSEGALKPPSGADEPRYKRLLSQMLSASLDQHFWLNPLK